MYKITVDAVRQALAYAVQYNKNASRNLSDPRLTEDDAPLLTIALMKYLPKGNSHD